MAVYNLITDPIKLNEFRFYRESPPATPLYATKPFDGWSATDTNLPWMMDNTFFHKKLFNDICTVYIQTQANFIGSALPYPDLQLIDKDGAFIADLSIVPFIKGAQQVAGNVIYDERIDDYVQANTYCWSFSFQDLLSLADSGMYRLRCVNLAEDGESALNFITEPIFVYGQDAAETYPETVLISCYNNSNNADQHYIKGGWDDSNYFPIFRHRVDGYLTDYDPKGVYIGMLNSGYQPVKVKAQNYRSWLMELGGATSNGVPDFVNEKVHEAFSADVFYIDGKRYMRDEPDTDTGVKSFWQGNKPSTANLRWVNIRLREYKNDQYIFFDQIANPCVCPTLVSVRVTKSGATYYANYEFNLPDGVTCPFIIYTTSHYPGGSFTSEININSTADLVDIGGDNYTKQTVIGGYPDISYAINKATSGVNCYAGEATYDCSPSVISSMSITGNLLDGFFLNINYTECGITCQSMAISFTQLLPSTSTPQSDSYTDVVDCPPVNPYTHLLNPNGYDEGGTIKYRVSWTDCCGNTGSTEIELVPAPAPLELWQSPWKEHGELSFVPYALTSWTLGNGVDPNSPFSAYVMYDETEEDAVIAAMNVIISGLGYGGTITKDATTKIVTYNGVAGETPSNVIATRTLWHHYSVDVKTTSSGNFRIVTQKLSAGDGAQIVDWGDSSTIDEYTPATLTVFNMQHAYSAGPNKTANVFHEENIAFINLNNTSTPVPKIPVLDFYGELPISLRQLFIQSQTQYMSLASGVVDFDLSRCAANIREVSLSLNTNLTDFATGFWAHNMPNLRTVAMQSNKFTSTAVDNFFIDFKGATATPFSGGTANTSSQTPAAPPTAASLADRTSLSGTYTWTITTD